METWQDLHVFLYLNKGKSIEGVLEIPLCTTQWPPKYSPTDIQTSAPTTIVMANPLEKLEGNDKQKDAEILRLSNRIEAIEQQLRKYRYYFHLIFLFYSLILKKMIGQLSVYSAVRMQIGEDVGVFRTAS